MSNQILDSDFFDLTDKHKFSTAEVKEINFIKIDIDEDIKEIKKGRIAIGVLLVLTIIYYVYFYLSILLGMSLVVITIEMVVETLLLLALLAAAWQE